MAADKQFLEAELRLLLGAHRQGSSQAARNRQTSTHPKLKSMVAAGSKANLIQAKRIEEALTSMGVMSYPHHDVGMQGICNTNEAEITVNKHPPTRDLLNIAYGQVAAHFYIAKYGTLRSTARALRQKKVVKLLSKTLKETYEIDREFTRLYEHLVGRPTSSRYPGETALRTTAAMHPALTTAIIIGTSVVIAALFSSSQGLAVSRKGSQDE